ncbi:MAG TPA: DUF4082 domain-containing protein, partial [Nocardioidaceae bacterium]|nr:DUF4082 domain-containing protein [Nocardioidaceae bacterium]
QAENYWVDVIFTTDGTTPTDTTKPTVTTRTPSDGATNVPVSTTVTAIFSEPVTASTPQVAVRTDAGTQIPGTVAYTAASQTVTFTPASPLTEATKYTVTVTGATDTAGNTMDPVTWSFTTAAPAADTTKPTLTGRSPATGATGVATTSTVTATFSEAVDPATPVVDLKTASGTTASGSTTYTAGTNTVTFTPSAALQPGTTYTATVSGAKDAAGNVMDPASWSFTTAADAGGCPCTIWADTTTPATPAQSDSKATELGVKFRASQNGFVTGIRFYKGTGNTGTHVGSLWNSAGTRLATATFANETATGWQQVSFPAPVAITAGTTYVASYHAPVGRYAINSNYFATSATVRGPLTALQNGTDGGNGVYRYSTTAGTFPTSSYQSSNYWVDVVFAPDSAPPADTTKPSVTARTPADGATGVPVSTTVTATFSEPVSSAALALKDDAGGSVAGTTTYTASTQTLTFTPNAALAGGKSYTATVNGATDAAGNTMDAVTWTFTTAAQGSGTCPCTIWPASATPGTSSASDSSAVEVGVRFRAEQNGYITGVRFYKGTGNTGTHVGSLWSTSGTRLASVTFTGETATGWQQATFGAPVPVAAGTTYIASYHAPNGHYANDNGYFAAAPVSRGPLTALQDGPGTANGVYAYGGPGTFPTSTFSSTNYWVDVVFDVTAADTVAPTVVGRAPAPGAADVPTSSPVTATFSEPVDAASVSMVLRAPGGTVVPAAVTYDAASLTATLRPNAALATSTTYTAQVSGARDGSGNTMQSDSWTFSTAAPPPPPPDQGASGPIAVVKSSSNPSSAYLAEILRAEGITHFTTLEATALTSGALGGYDIVVLGDVPLTDAQVTAIGDWVQAGGNLVAMKPDQRLAPLLGLSAQSGTTGDAYLAVDQSTSAGAGITPETIQYKGPADRYSLSGAQAVARIYSTATSATSYPAVTVRDVGTNGGQAAAFTYDLAKSVIRQRQGNPAWAGQERDGRVVIRTDDMFFGGSSPDWIDFNKVQIPQADEQQRLLVNLMTVMDRDRMPLPRFWYFPNMNKAVVVATGDDHGKNGTAGRFDRYSAMSPAGCSVDDWQCLRFSSYIYPDTPLTPTQASTYTSQGFEVGLHVNNGCRDYTSRSDLEASYTTDLTSWTQRYGGIPSPDSNRIHCLVWSDWSSHPLVELGHNMRLDVNYYYWPSEWVKDRPGFMTGSGMPMRLTDTGGTMLDVYQATTQMTDESGQSYPFTPATLLDRALGPLGYYGAFTANMHTDTATSSQDDALLSEATSRGVPMVSGRQMLRWLDGRNSSAYKNLQWSTDRLTFTLSPGSGARGLTGMLPTTGPGGRVLSTVTRGGSPVSFTKVTIKGQEYGVFSGAAGDYVAVYGGAPAAATTTATTSGVTTTSATVSWNTSTPGTSVLSMGTSPQQLDTTVEGAGSSTAHETTLTALDPGQTYFYRVTSTDARGRRSVWPARGTMPAMFTTAPPDSRNPSVSNVLVQPLPDGTARVTWSSDEVTSGAVDLGTSTSTMSTRAMSTGQSRQHTALLTDLRPGATYLVRVRSTDAAGNTGTQVVPTRFVASAAGVADHTGAQFMSGDAGPGIAVDRSAAGAITLKGRTSGSYTSRILDAQQMVEWDRATWTATAPAGASLRVSVRLGSTAQPDGTWGAWQPLSATGDRVLGHSRYLQYRLELNASKGGTPPSLTAIGFTHNGSLPHSDKETP